MASTELREVAFERARSSSNSPALSNFRTRLMQSDVVGAPIAKVTGTGPGFSAPIAATLGQRGHHVTVTDVDRASATKTADNVTKSVAFLVRDDAGFMTGEVISINRGALMD